MGHIQLVYGVVPAAVAVVMSGASVLLAWKARSRAQFALVYLILFANGCALLGLLDIFVYGGWPTYLPHILIGCTVLLVLAQAVALLAKLLGKKRDAA